MFLLRMTGSELFQALLRQGMRPQQGAGEARTGTSEMTPTSTFRLTTCRHSSGMGQKKRTSSTFEVTVYPAGPSYSFLVSPNEDNLTTCPGNHSSKKGEGEGVRGKAQG
jgi:hypothetical protein